MAGLAGLLGGYGSGESSDEEDQQQEGERLRDTAILLYQSINLL